MDRLDPKRKVEVDMVRMLLGIDLAICCPVATSKPGHIEQKCLS
jgi:hypothetical protein